jgi:hypothetical protein
LQNQLGLGSYRTAWMLCAKLRRAMVNPGRQPLSGLVEADETIIPFRTKTDPVVVPAGRSGVGKMLVAGAVEIDGGKPRRARLKAIEGFGKPELHAFVLGSVAPQTQLVTDNWPSYHDLPGVQHNAITLGPMAAHVLLRDKQYENAYLSRLPRYTRRAALDTPVVFKPQALGPGCLPRTAENQPPALP